MTSGSVHRSSSRPSNAATCSFAIATATGRISSPLVVDDWLQGVNLVIRGEDLLESTGRQIQLARLLGREQPPAFLHHELLMKTPHRS